MCVYVSESFSSLSKGNDRLMDGWMDGELEGKNRRDREREKREGLVG